MRVSLTNSGGLYLLSVGGLSPAAAFQIADAPEHKYGTVTLEAECATDDDALAARFVREFA
jgi:hypothetical protein